MNPLSFQLPSPVEEVTFKPLNGKNIRLFIKRDDLIHPDISGNKWRKLKWNFEQAKLRGNDTILTFGGAHSNHIAATAAAAQYFGFKSIGLIRGEDADLENPTLSFARNKGMKIVPIPRSEYREADSWTYREKLKADYDSFYLVPQGGSNFYGVQGCMEIMQELDFKFDRIFVACGTATTVSGMVLGNNFGSEIYGIAALKGAGFLLTELEKNLKEVLKDSETEHLMKEKFHLILNYHFGGYAKVTAELIDFMRSFFRETGVKLDPIYTAKTAFGMADLAAKIKSPQPEKWLLIHSGGLQGMAAMEKKLKEKIYP